MGLIYGAYSNTMGPDMNVADYLLKKLPPIFYVWLIGPMLLFKIIDYVITGESTSYPGDRKR
tara:strand:+ start:128 stop:313 length:186 start_codon:yes stop_codon:yes gene_type:complete